MSKLAPSPSCLLHRLTCCCWKDLSLFLKREGRTKSHPLARKASSPLRSGSRRNDVSLIIMVGAETRNPPPDTATGAATDTATDRLARRAKQGNRVDCSKEVHLTAQISRNQKKIKNCQTPSGKHVCDLRRNAPLAITHKISLLQALLVCTRSQSSNPAVYLCKEMFLKTLALTCRLGLRTMALGCFRDPNSGFLSGLENLWCPAVPSSGCMYSV